MKNLRVGILGAGLGSRLASRAKAKPLALIGGQSLLSHLISRLKSCGGISHIHCALRDELLTDDEKSALPKDPLVTYGFVNTESSLHTLVALIEMMGPATPALFTMADTVLKKSDLQAFLDFCRTLKSHENAVLVTTFVDDEKPLWVHLGSDAEAKKFNSEPAQHITSGMYFLQPQAMEIAKELPALGVHKMRNFLAELTMREHCIKTFVVSKTIDVDHPSDLDKAAEFMNGD